MDISSEAHRLTRLVELLSEEERDAASTIAGSLGSTISDDILRPLARAIEDMVQLRYYNMYREDGESHRQAVRRSAKVVGISEGAARHRIKRLRDELD